MTSFEHARAGAQSERRCRAWEPPLRPADGQRFQAEGTITRRGGPRRDSGLTGTITATDAARPGRQQARTAGVGRRRRAVASAAPAWCELRTTRA
jgi:hypothetical protein